MSETANARVQELETWIAEANNVITDVYNTLYDSLPTGELNEEQGRYVGFIAGVLESLDKILSSSSAECGAQNCPWPVGGCPRQEEIDVLELQNSVLNKANDELRDHAEKADYRIEELVAQAAIMEAECAAYREALDKGETMLANLVGFCGLDLQVHGKFENGVTEVPWDKIFADNNNGALGFMAYVLENNTPGPGVLNTISQLKSVAELARDLSVAVNSLGDPRLEEACAALDKALDALPERE